MVFPKHPSRCSAPAGEASCLDHAQLVDRLLALPRPAAAKEAALMLTRANFVSTYAFGKMLTEQMLDDQARLPGVSKVIVRPSLISSVAGLPYPG